MSKETWNERYSSEEYAYGEEPNEFFKENLDALEKGRILLPADGEGRNSVYAARKGWQVTAFDQSEEGRKKALKLAKKFDVKIDYKVATVEEAEFEKESFDVLAVIFLHMEKDKRKAFFDKFLSYLKPGGELILEAFTKDQLSYGTGGPKEPERLYTLDELKEDLKGLSNYFIEETKEHLEEGKFHSGMAAVVRAAGKK